MNWDRIEGNWKQFEGNAVQQWGKLTGDQLEVIAGRRDLLLGRIQELYGISRKRARSSSRIGRRACSKSAIRTKPRSSRRKPD